MSPVAETLISTLTSSLSGSLVKAAGRRVRQRLEDPERAQALERCCQAGIVAMLGTSQSTTESQQQLLEDILREFFSGEETREDVGKEITLLTRGHRLDPEAIEELFAAAGFEAEKLPGVDLHQALEAFEGAFITAAIEETALQGEIKIGVLVSQLDVLRDMRKDLRRLVEFLAQTRPGSVEVAQGGRVKALSSEGQPIALELSPAPPTRPPSPLAPYLERVMRDTGQLTLSGVDPAVAVGDADAALKLDAVYTGLLSQEMEDIGSPGQGRYASDHKPISALEQLNRHERLVLLGDPGSGKSTFVNFVALSMAGETLGSERIGLDLLTAPLPDEQGQDQEERQPWDHKALVPLRVVLRDFAARGLPAAGEPCKARHLWAHIERELQDAALDELAQPLKQEFQERGGLILLDGLDEVPEAEGRREQILKAVADFTHTFSRCRFLVTCRTYAYQHQRWRLKDFQTASLAPLGNGQIRRFISRWYEHIAVLRQLKREDARGRAALLEQAIFGSERLRSLAERPLLLTLMASLHAWREGSLPERREELYADSVNLLLDFWERKRLALDASGQPVLQQPSLAEWLKADRSGIRALLNRLAFRAHAEQPDLVGTADVPEGDLVAGLLKISDNPDVRPGRLMEYLCDRAGLLLARGAEVYTFPHRTFQEYLTACHLTDVDFPDEVARLARSDPERWREVTLLAGAKAARGTPAAVWDLAASLCYREIDCSERTAEDAHGAHLAGLLTLESGNLEQIPERHQQTLERIRAWQVDLLRGTQLEASDRTECGQSAGRLGDLREHVLSIKDMEMCRVPAGSFRMGEDPPTETEIEEDYWIGRFPLTQAQFAAFVDAGGYREPRYWAEARNDGLWTEGAFTLDGNRAAGPWSFIEPLSLPNHPAVGMSWYEASAFCRWLSELTLKDGRIPSGWVIRLPREAEWEKAARGGLAIPSRPHLSTIQGLARATSEPNLISNAMPERTYPWGEEIDGERANYDTTRIGATSAVGCFAKGASPYGCEEMSGNVWEWCADAEKLSWTEEPGRVLRGGGWPGPAVLLRAAYRDWYHATDRSSDVGFRVLAAPASLGT